MFHILALALALTNPCARAEWKEIREKNGIRAYQQTEPNGSGLVTIRGTALVDAPIARVASVIYDPVRAAEWIDSLRETTIFKWNGDLEFLEYDHMGAPLFIKDRDFLCRVKISFEPAKKEMTFAYEDITETEAPSQYKETRGVRGALNGTYYTLTSQEDGQKTFVLGEAHVDPKGSIPKWVVNLFQKDWPLTTLGNLRMQVAKPDIKNDPKIEALIQAGLKPNTTNQPAPSLTPTK